MSTDSVFPQIPTTSVKEPTTTEATIKELDRIAPCFFVGPHEIEKKVAFEPEPNQDSGSVVGYGDRRLSGILAETTEGGKKEESAIEIPSKRVILDAADANRGIFGDKRLKVANRGTCSAYSNNQDIIAAPHVDPLEPSKTVRVFGYPSNLLHNVIEHFMTYGKIEEYHESPGNWVTITYESSTSALAALKSNGIIISKTYMIGVSMEEEAPIVTQGVVPLDVNESVYKSNQGLGNGKVGVSINSPSHVSNGIISIGGIMSKLKDTFFGW
ncbi:hypothetical protein EDC94DRAFT_596182 [Helicostylum pulchrum]|nr:hypothetical protein EDC94DRAFT_596182 [Helicostylum pulchrum]